MSMFTPAATTVFTNSEKVHYCSSAGSAGTSAAPESNAATGSQAAHIGGAEPAHDVNEKSAHTAGVDSTTAEADKEQNEIRINNKLDKSFSQATSAPPTSLPYCFVSDETLEEEMARLEGLRKTNPTYAQELLKLAVKIVEAAKEGDVETLVSLMFFNVREGEVLKWAVGQAFCEACKRGHVGVVEMLCTHGLKPVSFGLTEAMHQALENTEEEVGGHVQVLRFLITRTGLDVSHMRKTDSKTMLHLACHRGFVRVAKALLLLGADLNAVADDDSTPLGLLLSTRETAAAEQDAYRASSSNEDGTGSSSTSISMSAVMMKEIDTLAMAMSRLGARKTAF